MEPFGVMDNRSLHDEPGDFSVCDVADEEVHFSREILANNQPFNQAYSGQYQLYKSSAISFADHQYHANQHQPAEQAKSSKLLSSIGCKLRRGSHFLAVPSLVSHYLLGITIRDWSEFLNTARIMKAPTNTHQLTRRLLTNLSHFQGNYLCVSLILVIYCILTSPMLLLAIIGYFAALYLVTARSATGKHLKIANFRPNLQQQYSFLTLISLPLLWVAGAPSAVFWVIGASFVVVGLHASMYSVERPQDQLEQQAQPSQQQANSWSQLTLHQRSLTQYYNHRPIDIRQQRQHLQQPYPYLTLAPSPAKLVSEGGSTSSPSPAESNEACQPKVEASSTSSSYTSSISQWVMFGAGGANRKAGYKLAPGNSLDTGNLQGKRSEVTIVSQDYAGLGRVYEI